MSGSVQQLPEIAKETASGCREGGGEEEEKEEEEEEKPSISSAFATAFSRLLSPVVLPPPSPLAVGALGSLPSVSLGRLRPSRGVLIRAIPLPPPGQGAGIFRRVSESSLGALSDARVFRGYRRSQNPSPAGVQCRAGLLSRAPSPSRLPSFGFCVPLLQSAVSRGPSAAVSRAGGRSWLLPLCLPRPSASLSRRAHASLTAGPGIMRLPVFERDFFTAGEMSPHG